MLLNTTNKRKDRLNKFCKLCPKHVKLFDSIPHNVYICQHHENVRLLLGALKDHTNLPTDIKEFSDIMMCTEFSKECANRDCEVCNDNLTEYAPAQEIGGHLLQYYQWQNQDRIEKVEITSSVAEAFKCLLVQLRPFLVHVCVKRK